jgi:hypothetical protein
MYEFVLSGANIQFNKCVKAQQIGIITEQPKNQKK